MSLTAVSDLDLLSLCNIEEFDFKKWVKDTLRVYVDSGSVRKMPLPIIPQGQAWHFRKNLSITFDEKKDVEIIDWLLMIRKKQRSNAIKSLLRCSLESPCLFSFYAFYPPLFFSPAMNEYEEEVWSSWTGALSVDDPVDSKVAEIRDEFLFRQKMRAERDAYNNPPPTIPSPPMPTPDLIPTPGSKPTAPSMSASEEDNNYEDFDIFKFAANMPMK